MAIVSLTTIKNWFKTGLKPTQAQFWDVWDSFRHKSESVPYAEIEGLDAVLLEQNNKINALSLPDTVLKTGEIMANGLNITIAANEFQWRLSQQSFLVTPTFSRVLPAATDGFKRTDRLEGDNTGNYFINPGTEGEFAAPAPDLTEGRISLAEIPVFGGVIGVIETSFPNEIETPFTVIDRANRKGISIWPFTISLWKWVSSVPVYVNVFIDNVTQKYDVQFPNKPTGTETFAMLSDLDSKLDISDYNPHYKSVYLTEAALIAANPTGVAGDNAQVNEVGSTDVVNYSWDAEENVWVNNGTGGSGAINTDALPEGSTNLYFQTARVLATLLTGISFVTGGAIVSTDSVLVAFGKLQKQITDLNTTANIKSLLGITTLYGSNTGDQDLSGLATKVQNSYIIKHFKSYFTAITGYTATGFTPTYADGKMIFTGGTNDFTKYITIDGLKNTDENIEIEVIYKVTTIGASGYGLGIGKRSINTWAGLSVCCQFSPISSSMNIWNALGMVVPTNFIGTKKFPQVAVNDIIKQKYTQIGNTIIYSVENLTTKIYSELVVTGSIGTTNNFFVPNSADICIWNIGSTNEIMSIKTTSLSAYQPDILVIGDSKSSGQAATDINLRWANNIDSLGTVISNAATADRTVEATQTIDYTKTIKAKYAILAIGRNDLGSGVASGTWQTNYANIVTQLESVGTIVIHLLPIPETTITDQSALNTWINATYPTGLKIDPSVGWNNATMLSSDTVHPNATGYLFIAKKIIDSGFITPPNPLKKLLPIPRPLVPYINDLSIPTQSIGGTIIFFNQPMVYGTSVTAETANITNDLTDAKVGIIQKIYHTSGTAPTYPAGWVLIGSGVYSTTVQNKIYAEFVGGTRVEYWITQ
jgi:lysophospholipase L1-like esterase